MDTIITGVMFGQDEIQISFLELADQNSMGSLEQTLLYALAEPDIDLVKDIQEALIEIIDRYKTSLRQPPETIERRKNRFARDEDDD